MSGTSAVAWLACGAAVWIVLPIVRAFRGEAGRHPRGTPLLPDPASDAAERAVRRWREREVRCPRCGPRPESEALYCSNCGQELVD